MSDPIPRDVADTLAADLCRLPGVADLHPGQFGEVALLYPRHRVAGLRLAGDRVEVHLVVDLSARRPLTELADAARDLTTASLTATAAAGLPVDVHLADATSARESA